MNNSQSVPYIATHPGELIKDEIKARGLSQKQLAQLSGIAPSVLSETIRGHRSISLNMASSLEKALDIPAEIWLNLQNQYDLDTMGVKSRKSPSVLKFVRILMERYLKDPVAITESDRTELNKINTLLRQSLGPDREATIER